MTADDEMNAKAGHYGITLHDIRASLRALYTGREIDLTREHALAKEWLEGCETAPEGRPDLERRLLDELEPTEISTDDRVFRGRFFESAPADYLKFGPPKPKYASRGRYNVEGEPVLYLCSSVTGVRNELGSAEPGWQLWSHRFRLSAELRLVDTRDLPPESFAAVVFWLIESVRVRSEPPPRLGSRLGQLLARRYDGMVVRGVRGDGDPPEEYWNVVVFDPINRWTHLVDRGAEPEEKR